MPATASLTDIRRFADNITQAGGTVPPPLANLLASAELLMTPGATEDPLRPILDQALAGRLDQKRLDTMLADAARVQQIANYKQDLRQRGERAVVERWHQALKDGCADDILDSLRPVFDEHAQAISRTRSVINPESTLEHIVASAQPGDGMIEAWQQLDGHLAAISKIGAVASQFGCRPTAQFPLITEYPGDNFRTDDRALYCANDPSLETDSAPFLRTEEGHRKSAWFAVPLRLATVAQAAERYRAWCEGQWEKGHPNPVIQHQRPDGSVGEITLKNPFAAKELAT